MKHFLPCLGAKASRDISHLTARDISAARDHLSKKLTPSSANFLVKTLRTALNQALRDGLVDTNERQQGDAAKTASKGEEVAFH